VRAYAELEMVNRELKQSSAPRLLSYTLAEQPCPFDVLKILERRVALEKGEASKDFGDVESLIATRGHFHSSFAASSMHRSTKILDSSQESGLASASQFLRRRSMRSWRRSLVISSRHSCLPRSAALRSPLEKKKCRTSSHVSSGQAA